MKSIEEQCRLYGLPIETIVCRRCLGSKSWAHGLKQLGGPELAALAYYQERGYVGSWCEGGTLKMLMKATGFPVLVKYNFFHDRADARTRFFEAQCTLLKDHHDELLNRIATAPLGEIALAAMEILKEPTIKRFFPRVSIEPVLQLWKALGSELLANIAQIFVMQPYDFRSGWPDLTLLKDGNVRFVEVKTTDLLRAEQLRILEKFARPLQLDFSVAHVVPQSRVLKA